MVFLWLGIALCSASLANDYTDGGSVLAFDDWPDPTAAMPDPWAGVDLDLVYGTSNIDVLPERAVAPVLTTSASSAHAPTAEDRMAVAVEVRTRD